MGEEPTKKQVAEQGRGHQKQMKQIPEAGHKKGVSAMLMDGKLEIVMTGKLQVRRILLDQSLLENPDKRVLQDNLVLGVNTAIQKAQNLMAVEMQKMAGDMGLPPDAMNEALGGDSEGDDDTTGGGEAAGGGRLRRWLGR